MTDQSHPAEPEPGGELSPHGDALPRQDGRSPADDSQPWHFGGERARRQPPADSLPGYGAGAERLPPRGGTWASAQELAQRLGNAGAALPQRNGSSTGSDALPQRNGAAGLPAAGPAAPLPRRTSRTRPAGRHRSPHRLSVASDAPALVIAVPGTAAADTFGVGPQVASIAAQSCPGVEIRVGYLDGTESALSEWLEPEPDTADADSEFPSVIVPLLLSPNPRLDPVIGRAAADHPERAIVAAHLGPHPLVAEALHARLAEAGLARQARSAGLSIAAGGRGVVVLADAGEEATSAAAVAAVLLASRLSVPVVPASLGDPNSIVAAVEQLSDSGAPQPVLAPCLIGPETSLAVLDDLSAALGAPCAPVLGAHQAVGQLVAIRYGAALTRLSLAG